MHRLFSGRKSVASLDAINKRPTRRPIKGCELLQIDQLNQTMPIHYLERDPAIFEKYADALPTQSQSAGSLARREITREIASHI